MVRMSFRVFCFVVVLASADTGFYAKAEDGVDITSDEYLSAQGQIYAALASGDSDIISSALSRIIAHNPKFALQFVSYIVSINSSYALDAISVVQSEAPEQASTIISKVADQLSRDPANEMILARILTSFTPAAGVDNDQKRSNTDYSFKNKVPAGIVENPNQNSDS